LYNNRFNNIVMKLKKNELDWLFNQSEAKKAVPVLGARNLTQVASVIIHTTDQCEELETYDKMIMHGSQEADQKLIEWIKLQIEKNKTHEKYIYFRFKCWN